MTTPQPGSTELRSLIEARLKTLHDEIAEKLGDAAEVSEALGRDGDTGDQSVADDAATADFADARRDIEEYRAGEAALARLEAGTYGECTSCGESIAPARLRASPFAARCLACQARSERSSGVRHTTI